MTQLKWKFHWVIVLKLLFSGGGGGRGGGGGMNLWWRDFSWCGRMSKLLTSAGDLLSILPILLSVGKTLKKVYVNLK